MLFDLYVRGDSWLHRRDPRAKLLLVLLGALPLVVLNHVGLLAGMVLAVHLLLLSARIPAHRILWLWRQMWRLLVLIVILWPVFSPPVGPALFRLGPVVVTVAGLLQGVATASRVIGLSLLFFVLLFTTEQNALVRGLVRLGLPFEWGLTLAVALRYIPSFAGLARQIQEAQQARGWDATRGDVIKRLRAVIPLMVALIIGVLRTSDTLSMALAARGVGSRRLRTSRVVLRFDGQDWFLLIAAVLLAAALVGGRFFFALGAQVW